MTKKEREQLRRAFELLWRNENDDFGDGMRILAKLAGIQVPAFDALNHATPVDVVEVARRSDTYNSEKKS